ncbi:MAG: hypothetical protein U0Q18_25140 [Bryobacteraceae bacterium]
MHEHPDFAEMRAAWLNQPEEEIPVDVEDIYRRRTRELFSTTRSEVMSSIGAALFFVSVVAWRFAPESGRLVQIGCAAVLVWAAVTLFRFRSSIRRSTPSADDFARTGLEHYRGELARRRDHLRSAWIWHGPLWLAGILGAATLAGRIVPGRLWDALPAVLLLAGWAAIGVKRRLRQAAELQREIDELTVGPPMEG